MGKVSVPIQIRFADIDMARHVHNSVYLHWFELARLKCFGTFLAADHDWDGQGVILARNEVDYRMPVLLTDDITVDLWCSGIGNKSFDLNYAVIRSGDRSGICAEGRSVMVSYDFKQGKSTSIPDAWRNALEKIRI